MTCRLLLAVVVFTRRFRPYLLGHHFVVRTDHGSFKWLRNFKNPEGQLALWLQALQEYDCDILHGGGKKHENADALSSLPCSQSGRQDELEEDTRAAPVAAVISWKEPNEIRLLQVEDPNLQPIMETMSSHQPLSPELLRVKSRNWQQLFQLQDQLTLKGGLLYRKYIGADGKLLRLQLVVPKILRKDIL